MERGKRVREREKEKVRKRERERERESEREREREKEREQVQEGNEELHTSDGTAPGISYHPLLPFFLFLSLSFSHTSRFIHDQE